jgi:hypothetical protein
VAVFVVVHHSAINALTLVTRMRLKWRTSSMAGRALYWLPCDLRGASSLW